VKNNFFYKKEYSNIYKTTSRFSEVTSQILYVEKFKILSKKKDWIKIKSLFDNYIGYIKNKNYVKNYKLTHKVYKKGNVIFWKGHVAICINSKKLIHAYGPEKKVLIMPISKTIERIKKTANLSIKKISSIKY